MRLNPDGTIHTWSVTDKKTGESLLVDDRTFDPAQHEDPSASDAESEEQASAPSGGKSTKKGKGK